MPNKKLDPKCPACESRIVYTLKDGTQVCRKCGHREPPKEKDGEK